MRGLVSRPGFALPFALVTMAVSAIAIAALGGYAAFSSRMTRYHIAHSRCRLAAQSAIEQTKTDVANAFDRYVGEVAPTVKITPVRTDVYRWFDYGDASRIGTRVVYEIVDPADTVDGICRVHVWFGDHRDGIVQICARATGRYAGGPEAVATIRETVVFGGLDQSPVFDNAYFVNNYGWMNGSSIVINGKMRANGNVSLSGSTVNGFIYAARNTEVGANGTVTLSSSPQIKNASSYRGACGNRARPDHDDYATPDAYDAPARSGAITKPTRYEYDDDGDIVRRIGGTRTAASDEAIVNEYAPAVPMPFVSDLQDYIDYARDEKSRNNSKARLTAPAYGYTDGLGQTRSVAAKTVDVHYDGAGPSGDAALADKGALVLIGTKTNPIRIDGPVVVDSDVVIKGYVKGQGTIYSGRNVHIIGDIIYSDPPTWAHPDADDAATADRNATKDMLGLVAKGNIVIGDSTDTAWHNSVDNYIKSGTSSSVVKKYACDPSDANIGYPAVFQGNYTAVENVNGQTFAKVRPVEVTKTREEHYQERYVTGYNRWGQAQYGYRDAVRQVNYTETVLGDALNRRYYETVCDDSVLKKLKDSTGIAQIDAILYNNHGIFGTPGRANATFNLNGSLVCRDEALIFSGSGIRFNWDFRLGRRSNSKERRRKLGLPVGLADETHTIAWEEVADD